jgi:hypothetical protein
MSTSGSRLRRQVSGQQKTPVKLGYFESAQLDGAGNLIQWLANTRVFHESLDQSPKVAQVTKDSINPGYPHSGGDFTSLKYENSYIPNGVFGRGTWYNRTSSGKKNRRYIGGFCSPPNSLFGIGWDFVVPGPLLVTTSTAIPSMSGLGDRAWNATKPKLQQATAFNFSAELREMPQMLKTSAQGFSDAWHTSKRLTGTVEPRSRGGALSVMQPKAAADHFLNHNFGWVPFIGDLVNFAQIVGYWSNMVKKLTKMNGVPVRKRVPLGSETSASIISQVSNAMPCFPVTFSNTQADGFYRMQPNYILEEVVETTSWGVGKFTYYRPEFDVSLLSYNSAWSKVQRFLTITGLRVNPSNLYNAIPWTWLIDWVTNIGNFVDYFNDIFFDQIVGHYCCAMKTRRTSRKLTSFQYMHDGDVTLVFERVIVSKQRQMNSGPYGFSLTWDQLTPRQLAIAGALGISRT